LIFLVLRVLRGSIHEANFVITGLGSVGADPEEPEGADVQ